MMAKKKVYISYPDLYDEMYPKSIQWWMTFGVLLLSNPLYTNK